MLLNSLGAHLTTGYHTQPRECVSCVCLCCVHMYVYLPVHAHVEACGWHWDVCLKRSFILFTCLDSLSLNLRSVVPTGQDGQCFSTSHHWDWRWVLPHPAYLHRCQESNLWSLHISESTLTTKPPSQPLLKLFLQKLDHTNKNLHEQKLNEEHTYLSLI